MSKKTRGFTLIETLITLIVIATLITLTYPSYSHYLLRAHRSDGQIALLDLANKMESYFSLHHTYAGANFSTLGTANVSTEGYYQLTIASTDATRYSLDATAIGSQAKDSACATLTLNQLGQKGATGHPYDGHCWH